MKKIVYLFLFIVLTSCESSQEEKLIEAIETGNKELITELLDSGIDPNSDASGLMGEGTTAIFEAACTGGIDILNMLIEAGGKVDHVMEFGTKKVRLFDKLSFTIGNKLAYCDFKDKNEVKNYIKIVNKVAKLGADIGAEKEFDMDNFDMDIDNEYNKTNALYTVAANSSFGKSDISSDCIPYMKDVLKTYLKLGADLDGIDNWSRTALIYHVQRQNFEMVSLLLELGADINKIGGDRSASPLWYAKYIDIMNFDTDDIQYNLLFENDTDLTRFLISKGAKEVCESC